METADTVVTALLLAAISWVPLLGLSLAGGLTLGGSKIPFLRDIAAHVRSLVAIPLLVIAEVPVGRALRAAAGRFLTTHLVREGELGKFDEILTRALRRRDSKLAESVMLAMVYISSVLTVFEAPFQAGSTWFRPSPAGLSIAGYWYVLAVLPMFQFLVLRWLYRIALWAGCLYAVSKLNLALIPTHPDRAGGLGFLSQTLPPFSIVLFALSAVASATIADRILFEGEKLAEYQWSYLILIVLLVSVFACPMLVFMPKLSALKERGLHQYGELATTYNQAFHSKWVESSASPEERLLGTGDIQSQAALESSFQVVRGIRPVPIEFGDFLTLAAPGIIPGLPLILTIVPASTLLRAFLKLAQSAS